jgi:hypothetical protein
MLAGCSSYKNKISEQFFNTKDEAIAHYIEQEKVLGSIVLLNLSSNEKLLFTEGGVEIYYLGELVEDKGKFSAFKLSTSVDIGNTTGAKWGFNTVKGNKYTIDVSKINDGKKQYISELGLGISVVEGIRFTEGTNAGSSLVKSYEILKSDNM